MRCIACNNILSEAEYRRKKPSGEEEDLCSYCKFIALHPNFCDHHEHQFEHITEIPVSITTQKSSENSS